MEVLKRLAPKYWLGYYCVYVGVLAYTTTVFSDTLRKWPETESLFVAAAMFAVSTGAALLSAVTAEGVGYVILLIPKRINELKEAGRAEVRAEMRAEVQKARAEAQNARAEGRAEALREAGRANGLQEGVENGTKETHWEGVRNGRAEERSLVRSLLACHDRGEITLDQLRAILAEHYNGDGESD